MSGTFQSPPGTQDWLPERMAIRRARGRARGGDLRRRRLPRDGGAADRGHRPVRPHQRRGLRRGDEGDVLVRRPRRSRPVAAPGADGGPRARLPAARAGDAAAAGAAVQLRQRLPLQPDAARAAAGVRPVRRRGDRLGRPGGRRRDHRAADALARGDRHGRAGARDQLDRHAGRAPRLRGRPAGVHRRARRASVSEDVRRLRDVNPLRAFDTKDERSRAVLAEAPKITDRLSRGGAEHFAAVRAFLDARGVAYRVEPMPRARSRLLHAHRVGDQVAAARRAVDGVRRRALRRLRRDPRRCRRRRASGSRRGSTGSCWRSRTRAGPTRSSAAATPTCSRRSPSHEARPRLHALLDELRLAGVRCEADLAGRSGKGQWKHAERLGARLIVQCGPDEWAAGTVQLRDRARGATGRVALADLVRVVVERIGTMSWYRTHGCGELGTQLVGEQRGRVRLRRPPSRPRRPDLPRRARRERRRAGRGRPVRCPGAAHGVAHATRVESVVRVEASRRAALAGDRQPAARDRRDRAPLLGARGAVAGRRAAVPARRRERRRGAPHPVTARSTCAATR